MKKYKRLSLVLLVSVFATSAYAGFTEGPGKGSCDGWEALIGWCSKK